MCPSISNILHGVVFKIPIIKQIYDYILNKQFERQLKFEEDRFNKYGDCEDEKIKLIFGTLSYDEMVRQYGATLYTMNDLDIIYDKESKKYSASVEAIYQWDDKSGIFKYLQSLLSQFTKYMIDNNLDTTYKIVFYDIFYGNITIDCVADTIEECYAKFKFMVEGYCKMWDEKESEE
jgi:flagellin-specific chaperone FliS